MLIILIFEDIKPVRQHRVTFNSKIFFSLKGKNQMAYQ
jgi:hypothetical protein